VAAAAAQLMMAATGASAAARGAVYERYARRTLLRRVLGGLRRATLVRSPRERARAAEARAAQLRGLHPVVETVRRALAGDPAAAREVTGGQAAVARARLRWCGARRAWPVEAAAAEAALGPVERQERLRRLALRWRRRAWASSRRWAGAALVEEVLEEDSWTAADRAAVAGRAADRVGRQGRLEAAARRCVAQAAARLGPAPRRRSGARRSRGGAGEAESARAAARRRAPADGGRDERRAAKAARRAAERRALEREEQRQPLLQPWYVQAVEAVMREASREAAEGEGIVVARPRGEKRARGEELQGLAVQGSRGRAAVGRCVGDTRVGADMTRSSVRQRVMPPVGSLRARAMVRG